jgi:hypothetical protein
MLHNTFFSIDDFKRVSAIHSPHCVSIYLPTHRGADEDDSVKKDRIQFKNLLQEIKNELVKDFKFTEKDAKQYLEPAEKLLEDNEFWRYLSDGLAVFIHNKGMEHFQVPVYFDNFYHISDHFYLKPLIPIFNGDGKFFLLNLSLNNVSLYEGTRHTIAGIDIADLVPGSFKDTYFEEDRESELQFRSGQRDSRKTGAFHGHNPKDEKLDDVINYFRRIDKGLGEVLNGEKAPLVVACVEEHFPEYQKANSYNNLYPEFIKGNPEHTDIFLQHEKAWLLLENYFNKERIERKSKFLQMLPEKKAMHDLEEVIPAAMNKRVDTLFVRNMKNVWGVYDEKDHSILIHEEKQPESTCLLDLAAKATIQNNGTVYLADNEDMPLENTYANAVLRF